LVGGADMDDLRRLAELYKFPIYDLERLEKEITEPGVLVF
jgi:hypothetical protein